MDLVKTTYTGDPEELCPGGAGCPHPGGHCPGGNGCKTAQDFIQMTRDVMDAGAAGVTYGRFVFQYPHVTPLVKTLGQVVHNGLSVKEAMELLDTLEHEDA